MKKIIITTEGFIESKGVFGPVLSPYLESDKEIMKMIARGIEVQEVLPEGVLRKLSISDLNKKKEHSKKEDKQVVKQPASIKPLDNGAVKVQFNNHHSKKEKKKNKQKQSAQNLGFEVDVLESK